MKQTLLVANLMLSAAFLATAQKTPESMLGAALHQEEVQGDLKGAIAGYQKVVATPGVSRKTAAEALVHVGQCYEKLGDAEARKAYERVVRDYADQKEAVALALARLASGAQSRRQTNTLVWSGSKKVDTEGTVSLDGRVIAFVDWDTGDLALHEIATGVDRRLTNKGTWKESDDFAEESAVSRDGKQVAYTWWKAKDKRPELRLANTAGDQNPRTLYDNTDISWIRPCDWSPDGKFLAIEVKRTDRTKQIGLIAVPEGSLRVLKSIDWRGAGRMFLSPDGKYLGYDLPQNDTGSERDVFVLSVDGAREIHAVAHPSNDVMMGWSPDGKWLLFASDRTGSMGLWGLLFADGKPQGAPELLKADFAVRAEPIGITQAGALYYGIRGTQDRYKIQVASFDFETGKLTDVSDFITQDYLESNALPVWSPDGRQVAYKSQRGPTQQWTHEVVVIRSLDTGQTRELRPKLSGFGPMAWAPSGRSFLTWGIDLKGRGGIFQIDPETGEASTLLLDQPGERSWYPRWAPDGQSFYFKRDYRATRDSALIQRNLATGSETELIRRRMLAQAGAISPDYRYLFSNGIDKATNSRTVLLIPLVGGEVRELMRYPSEVPPEDLEDPKKGVWISGATWAPDSRSFLAFKLRGNFADPLIKSLETWRIPIDGGEPRKFDDNMKLSLNNGGPRLIPDGRIAFTVTETTPRYDPEIWALDNFLPQNRTTIGKK